ncbi:hypothetical protein Pint_20864 [Pistacia integerrima]|uniref:Uncharacterized protein n=1 Tax=Pistacia integerrima TaxID=434235 RepID=A0ACC0X834_9ROSI|nr:hypothetical protein Pint_20864 [Pistacia integerrima]
MADQCNSRGVLGEIDLNILPILEATDEVDDITEKVNTHLVCIQSNAFGNGEKKMKFWILALMYLAERHSIVGVSVLKLTSVNLKYSIAKKDVTKQSEKYYLLPDEDEPLRTCKSKTFITKVMFLAAVTRPRFDESGNELFYGKIGIFPFINKEPARRSSKNRSAGTMETKTINSINKEIYRSYIIEKLLPAIRDKWPRIDAGSPIFIQQDNAKPHIGLDDEYFQSNATKDGFDIRLIYQPPNSPDMNVLDLGFFNAIQGLQYQQAPNSIDALIEAVQKSYEEQPAKKKPKKRKSMEQGLEAKNMKRNNDQNKSHILDSKRLKSTLPALLLNAIAKRLATRIDILWFCAVRNSFKDFPFPSSISSLSSQLPQETLACVNTRVDWKETPKAHEFKADHLGLKKEEVKVEIEDDRVLQISGERNV